jgi:DNA-binding winged helix-turn-helix (wHTH) protein/TolB-like protein/Tfp pilus assembly protein PilF
MSTASQLRQTWDGQISPSAYVFGPFVLDTLQHTLIKDGQPVALTPKTFDTLLLFVRNSGRMLLKEELMKSLWPDSFVEESNLTQQVSMIRRALGESANDPHYIVTVSGRGYRFIGDVRSWVEEKPVPPSSLLPSCPATECLDRSSQASHRTDYLQSSPTPQSPAVAPSRARQSHKTIGAMVLRLAVVVLLVAAVLLVVRSLYPGYPQRVTRTVSPRSLAILPLRNLRQTPEDDFLGFSLADAIITKLDYVSALTIRPSTAVEKYRNQEIDLQKVAADLNVDTLLTGSFIRDRDKLRITYQLVDVKSDRLLGKGRLDLKYDDLLSVQDNVAEQVIKNLQVSLSPSEAERIKADAPVNPLAYEYYLRGVDLHGQHNFPLAIKMLEKSTEIDPNYAPAWAYLGASYTSDAAFELGGREQYRRAQGAYERALAIRPDLLDAQIFLANLLVDTGRVEQAVPLLRDALKTNGNYAAAHWEIGYAYRFAGMLDESVVECERARQLDPLVKANGSVLNSYLYLGQYRKFLESLPVDDSSFILFYRGFGEFHEKQFAQAAKDFDRAYELDPTLYAGIGKALSDSIHGRKAEGLALLRELESKIRERGVGDPEATYKIAQAYGVLGEKISAMRALRMSVESGFFSYPYLSKDPLLNDLRREPDFDQTLNTARQRHEAFKSAFFK